MEPILNILGSHDLFGLEFSKDYLRFAFALHDTGLTFRDSHKHWLGRQTRCVVLARRYWVWERPNWEVWLSKRGIEFNVPAHFTPLQAWEAWLDYTERMNQPHAVVKYARRPSRFTLNGTARDSTILTLRSLLPRLWYPKDGRMV